VGTIASSDPKHAPAGGLAEARALAERGEAKAALKLADDVRARALVAGDLQTLEEVLALARSVHGATTGKPQQQAMRLAFSAQQNIRFVGRKQALAAGREWIDPYATPGDRAGSAQAPSACTAAKRRSRFPFGDPRRPSSLLKALAATGAAVIGLWALGLVIDMEDPSSAAVSIDEYHQVVFILVGVWFIGLAVAVGGWWRARRRYPASERQPVRLRQAAAVGAVVAASLASLGGLYGLADVLGAPSQREPGSPAAGASGVIAYVSDSGVSLVKADGSGDRRLAEGNFPAWSPDGGRIALSVGTGALRSKIVIVNADGSAPRTLIDGFAADWSPDGRTIAFTRMSTSLSSGYVGWAVWTITSDGKNLHRVTQGAALDDEFPKWSPDGRLIAFTRYELPASLETSSSRQRSQVCVARPDGTALRCLTSEGSNGFPSWSPDGARIAFISDRRGRSLLSGGAEIYVMTADGSGQRRVTNLRVQMSDLAWSPDGTRLAFASPRGNGDGVYAVNVDGTGFVTIVDAGGDQNWPAWRPLPRAA
jgi:WD40-like Beta Propeller Repeat